MSDLGSAIVVCACASVAVCTNDVGGFLSVFLRVYTLLLIMIRPCRPHCRLSSRLAQQCISARTTVHLAISVAW